MRWLREVAAAFGRLRTEALGLNRRNQAYMIPYNPRSLFALVDQKRLTKERLSAAGIPVPATLGGASMHWQLAGLGRRMSELGDFVIKPGRGAGGAGIVVVTGRRGEWFIKASGKMVSLTDLTDHASDILCGAYSLRSGRDEVILEAKVVPEPVLARVSYRGVPDVRVFLFRGVPVLAMARLPTKASDGRANLHMGGVGVGIDLVSGKTTSAVVGRRACTTHPDIGVAVVGITIPQWPRILEVAARCYDAVPLGLLGVDMVIDIKQGPQVLELNARPGLAIQLANRRGLRPAMERIAALELEGLGCKERIELGQEIYTGAGGMGGRLSDRPPAAAKNPHAV